MAGFVIRGTVTTNCGGADLVVYSVCSQFYYVAEIVNSLQSDYDLTIPGTT
jgi:hypothetical protein